VAGPSAAQFDCESQGNPLSCCRYGKSVLSRLCIAAIAFPNFICNVTADQQLSKPPVSVFNKTWLFIVIN
jgi:hypothetical protein